jgi:hypothetical protein
MKNFSKLLTAILICTFVLPALAHGGGNRHGGGFRHYHHGGYEFRHGWNHNWVGPIVGATILSGAFYAATRPVVVVQQPPIYLPVPQDAYYCSSYQQFYPSVPTCPVPWQIFSFR